MDQIIIISDANVAAHIETRECYVIVTLMLRNGLSDSESEEHQRENLSIDNLDFEIVDSTDVFLSLKNGQKIYKSSFLWNQQHDRNNSSSDIRRRFT